PGGLGHAVRRVGGLAVAALCAVNAHGDIDHGDGLADLEAAAREWRPLDLAGPRANTTIGVVVTNARLGKAGCLIVAQGAHDGLARAIMPPHTRVDGDAFVAAATGQVDADVDLVRVLALAAVTDAIRSVDQPT
ncbi:P1 family peptidase, partial [Frankia sp. AgKG'84/4]|uniref:P1 family peptidase n=1 Tax=Frankia sp. AgKG'84/4 TaxID=573490 RepID=UPI00202AAA72